MAESTILKDRVAIVTGAGSGIGAAIAHKLAELGSKVILVGRTRAKLTTTQQAITKLQGHSEIAECDIQNLQAVDRLAIQVETSHGRADILVNNAAVGTFGGPLHTMPPDAWDAVMNLRGVYYCIRSFVPLLIKAGRGDIINISSLAGKNPLPNGAAYAASKWALNGLSYSVDAPAR